MPFRIGSTAFRIGSMPFRIGSTPFRSGSTPFHIRRLVFVPSALLGYSSSSGAGASLSLSLSLPTGRPARSERLARALTLMSGFTF